jgi:hypothetical protein
MVEVSVSAAGEAHVVRVAAVRLGVLDDHEPRAVMAVVSVMSSMMTFVMVTSVVSAVMLHAFAPLVSVFKGLQAAATSLVIGIAV